MYPLYELAFGGGFKWCRPSWKELAFVGSEPRGHVSIECFASVDHLLIEILLSCPIDILQIYELLSMGAFVMYINVLCYLMC